MVSFYFKFPDFPDFPLKSKLKIVRQVPFGAFPRPPPPPAPAARPRPRAWRRRHRHRAARSAACAAARVALPSALAATATGGPFHVAMRSSLLFTPTGQTTPKRRERGADRDLVGAKGGRAGGTILGCGLGLPSVRETRSVLTFAVATPEAPTGRQDSTTRQAPETRAGFQPRVDAPRRQPADAADADATPPPPTPPPPPPPPPTSSPSPPLPSPSPPHRRVKNRPLPPTPPPPTPLPLPSNPRRRHRCSRRRHRRRRRRRRPVQQPSAYSRGSRARGFAPTSNFTSSVSNVYVVNIFNCIHLSVK